MRVALGSRNPIKIEAVRALVQDHQVLRGAELVAVEVDSGVAEQPLDLAATFEGARRRAEAARLAVGAELGVGLEDGVFEGPPGVDAWFNVCVACLVDATGPHFGTSSAFALPESVRRRLIECGEDLGEAMRSVGLSRDPALGRSIGAIGVLSAGRLDRRRYTIQALEVASLYLSAGGPR